MRSPQIYPVGSRLAKIALVQALLNQGSTSEEFANRAAAEALGVEPHRLVGAFALLARLGIALPDVRSDWSESERASTTWKLISREKAIAWLKQNERIHGALCGRLRQAGAEPLESSWPTKPLSFEFVVSLSSECVGRLPITWPPHLVQVQHVVFTPCAFGYEVSAEGMAG
jgi:hypothetical protein